MEPSETKTCKLLYEMFYTIVDVLHTYYMYTCEMECHECKCWYIYWSVVMFIMFMSAKKQRRSKYSNEF